MLAVAPFALGGLDRHAGVLQVPSRSRMEALGAGALQDVIVLEIPAGGLEVTVAFLRRIAIARAEEVVLQLRRGKRLEIHLASAINLASQDRPGCHRHQVVRLLVLDVADDERGFVEPARAPQRLHVRHEVEVAVAKLPIGELVPRHRIHFHVNGEEIVAGVRALLGDVLHEHLGVEALAHQAPVVIGEADDHRLDLSLACELGELVERQHPELLIHRVYGR